MARDFAKRRTSTRSGRTPVRKQANQRRTHDKRNQASSSRGLRLYIAGLLSGFFLSFLVYLGTLPAPGNPTSGNPTTEQQHESTAEVPSPKPRFEFPQLLREQTIEVDVGQTAGEPAAVGPAAVEPAADVSKPRSTSGSEDVYLLQAGSFRQKEDADRRRAELSLLGVEPTVQESQVDSGRWYRVYLGPFESHATMNRARGLTASQNIETLLLKRGSP